MNGVFGGDKKKRTKQKEWLVVALKREEIVPNMPPQNNLSHICHHIKNLSRFCHQWTVNYTHIPYFPLVNSKSWEKSRIIHLFSSYDRATLSCRLPAKPKPRLASRACLLGRSELALPALCCIGPLRRSSSPWPPQTLALDATSVLICLVNN